MNNHRGAYALLAERLQAPGPDVEDVKAALKRQRIETPSWGYANSGTRFKAFAWPGAATTTRQKLDDAAMVHKMTGIAPSVAIHIPWDKPDGTDYAGQDNLRGRKRRFEQGLRMVYDHLPSGGRMLIEYKFFEPAFYSTD